MISFWIELRYCCYGKTVHNGKAGAIFIPNIKTLAKNGFKQTLTEFSASDVTRSFTEGSWPKQGHSHLFGGTREQASFIFCRTVNQILALMTCTVMKRRASWQWMTPFITWRTTLAVCNWLKLCVGEQTTTRRTITITAAACGSWTAASRTHRHAPTTTHPLPAPAWWWSSSSRTALSHSTPVRASTTGPILSLCVSKVAIPCWTR